MAVARVPVKILSFCCLKPGSNGFLLDVECWTCLLYIYIYNFFNEPAQNILSNIQLVLHVCAYIQHATSNILRLGCIFLLFVLVLSILAFKMASASSEYEYNDTEFLIPSRILKLKILYNGV